MENRPARYQETATEPNACSIALFDRQSVLLIQRVPEPFSGLWTLPGGRMEPGEDAATCVTRELFEETGLVVVSPYRVLTETIGPAGKRYSLAVFAAHHPYTAPAVCDEIAGWEWVGIDEIGRYRTTPDLSRIVLACARHLDVYGQAS